MQPESVQFKALILLVIDTMYTHTSAQISEVTFKLIEHPKANTLVGNIFDVAQPAEHIRTLRLEAVEVSWLDWFRLDRQRGELFTTEEASLGLDRERICPHHPRMRQRNNTPTCGINLLASVNNRQLIKINILVLDLNDNPPKFPNSNPHSNVQELVVDESSEPGQTKFYLNAAYDADNGGQQTVIHFLDPPSEYFHLLDETDTNLGRRDLYLLVNKRLDYETIREFHFNLTACDGDLEWLHAKHPIRNNPVHCTSQKIHIAVRNTNDETPIFRQRNYSVVLKETTPVDYQIITLEAYDADSPPFNKVYYKLLPEKGNQGLFSIDSETGVVHLRKPFPSPGLYQINVLATNEQSDNIQEVKGKQRSLEGASQASVFVHVLDTNNHAPIIAHQKSDETNQYTSKILASQLDEWLEDKFESVFVQIPETILPPVTLAYFSVTDRDLGENARVVCSWHWSDKMDKHYRLPRRSFELYLVSKLTESTSLYRLVLKEPLDAENILKDASPVSSSMGDQTLRIAALLKLNVTCSDHGFPKMTGRIPIFVFLLDVDEFLPEVMVTAGKGVSSLTTTNTSKTSVLVHVEILENLLPGSIVMLFTVSDQDVFSQPRFEVIGRESRHLNINKTSGQIFMKIPYDYEAERMDHVHIVLYEKDSRNDSFSVNVTVNVSVTDVNDHVPVFTAPPLVNTGTYLRPIYSKNIHFDGIRLVEIDEEGRLNKSIVKLQAGDADSNMNGQVRFFLVEVLARSFDSDHVSQSGSTAKGNMSTVELFVSSDGTIWSSHRLDREATSLIDVLVGVHDLGEPRLTSYTSVRIVLKDINDHAPKWQFPTTSDYLITVRKSTTLFNQTLTRIHAIDLDDPKHNGRLTYEFLSHGNSHSDHISVNNDSDLTFTCFIVKKLLDVNPQTGVIKFRQSMRNLPVGFLDVWLKATDHGSPALNSISKLVIYLAEDSDDVSKEALLKLHQDPKNWITTKIRSSTSLAVFSKGNITRHESTMPLIAGGIGCGALLVFCITLAFAMLGLRRHRRSSAKKDRIYPTKTDHFLDQMELRDLGSAISPYIIDHTTSDSEMLPYSCTETQSAHDSLSSPSATAAYACPLYLYVMYSPISFLLLGTTTYIHHQLPETQFLSKI
ncbi:cadherin domain protein [Opisthorchis viverrini]|uniref:Cadherin domain protein n=1 Tax=Opisthorchis viverrini TaxID=6198 RepID=A0A1S8X875_OPIVI|nr:cadherin domain protein [Opisthorchis viverrini]